jgi:hypothetical protein
MKRAILVLAGLACCGQIGCDTRSTAKMILTVGLNSRLVPLAEDVISAPGAPRQPRRHRTPPIDELVAALLELDRLQHETHTDDDAVEARLASVVERIAESADELAIQSPASTVLAKQAREARAVALEWAARMLPDRFAGRLDAYWQATSGRPWNRQAVEKQAINRLVTGYVVAPKLPSDAAQVLALHAVTFPDHPMNVELFTTIAERLVGEGELRGGVALARAGLEYCANHSDVSRLQQRVKQICRAHPGEVGVPMNFAGPTMQKKRFILNSLHGRPVLVIFWSVTDSASDAFMVNCNTLAKHFSTTGIEVVGVSLNANMENLGSWYSRHGFSCPNVFSPEEAHLGLANPIARFYRVSTVPEFFLLDRDGIVIARGADDLAKVERELHQLLTP